MEDLEKGADLVIEAELLAKAERAKRRRFTRRGIVLAAIGFIFISVGIVLNTGPASTEGLFVGVGIIFLISSIISFLIGVINPSLADVVRRRHQRTETEEEKLCSYTLMASWLSPVVIFNFCRTSYSAPPFPVQPLAVSSSWFWQNTSI